MSREIHKHIDLKTVIALTYDIEQHRGILLIDLVFWDDVVGDGRFGGGALEGAVDGDFLEVLVGWLLLLLLLLLSGNQNLEQH